MPQPFHTIIIALIGFNSCGAATVRLDDFSFGEFDLASGGTTTNSIPFSTLLTDQRTIFGIGFPWTATLASEQLNYAASPRTPGRSYLNLNYSSSGTFSILGYDAFALDVANVTGTGEFMVFVDGAPTFGALRVPVTASGELVYALSEVVTGLSLDSLMQMNFRFIAVSEDFSVTIDNVRLVPEPSSSLLFALSLSVTILHRRRKN